VQNVHTGVLPRSSHEPDIGQTKKYPRMRLGYSYPLMSRPAFINGTLGLGTCYDSNRKLGSLLVVESKLPQPLASYRINPFCSSIIIILQKSNRTMGEVGHFDQKPSQPRRCNDGHHRQHSLGAGKNDQTIQWSIVSP
jgi:hypothetical protein